MLDRRWGDALAPTIGITVGAFPTRIAARGPGIHYRFQKLLLITLVLEEPWACTIPILEAGLEPAISSLGGRRLIH